MLVWVVGAGGLLGSSVRRSIEAGKTNALFSPRDPHLPWTSPPDLARALRDPLASLLSASAAADHGGWAIIWCAGGAVVASRDSEVSADRASWELFLSTLEAALGRAPAAARTGHLLLASSAGGAWAGHSGATISESTPVSPISEYGRGHLAREEALAQLGRRHPELRTAIVRLSNLYGTGQRLDKPQGLVSHIARSLIHRRPIHIYVPLDTVRDYLYASDAGQAMVEGLSCLARAAPGAGPVLKLLASEEETSVGGLIAIFRRVTRRQVAVTAGVRSVGRLQALRLRFRSAVWPELSRGRTPLPEGVVAVYRHQLQKFTSGELPVPPIDL
jgi:UDP-glucose 4-epimerase